MLWRMCRNIVFLLCAISGMAFSKDNELIVGTNAEFPPFCMVEKGEFVGFDIDVAKEVVKRLGKKIIIKDMPFEALIPEVILGKVDFVAAGMSYTVERAKRVLFTKPFFIGDPLVIVMKKTAGDGITLDALKDKVVIVNEGFTADLFLSSKEGFHLVRLPSVTDGFIALRNGVGAAFVTAQSTYDAYRANQSIANNNPFQSVPIPETSETSTLVVPKSKPELYRKISDALEEMERDGTLQQLKVKWHLHEDRS